MSAGSKTSPDMHEPIDVAYKCKCAIESNGTHHQEKSEGYVSHVEEVERRLEKRENKGVHNVRGISISAR